MTGNVLLDFFIVIIIPCFFIATILGWGLDIAERVLYRHAKRKAALEITHAKKLVEYEAEYLALTRRVKSPRWAYRKKRFSP